MESEDSYQDNNLHFKFSKFNDPFVVAYSENNTGVCYGMCTFIQKLFKENDGIYRDPTKNEIMEILYFQRKKKRIHTKYLKICKNSNELFKKIVSLLPEDTPIIFCISIAKNNINKWRNSVHESHALLFCKKQDSFHFFDPNYFWIKINNIDDLEKWFVKNYKPYNCYHIRKYENCLFDHD